MNYNFRLKERKSKINMNLPKRCLSILISCNCILEVCSQVRKEQEYRDHSGSPLKALDFSLDNDGEPDENNNYTHASLLKENLPPSFTICTATMVEAWTKKNYGKLYLLRDNKGKRWHFVKIYAATSYTQFSFVFEDSPMFSNQSKILFYPLQWTRICLSKDSNTSLARLVVDGELLIEEKVKVENKPEDLSLVLS